MSGRNCRVLVSMILALFTFGIWLVVSTGAQTRPMLAVSLRLVRQQSCAGDDFNGWFESLIVAQRFENTGAQVIRLELDSLGARASRVAKDEASMLRQEFEGGIDGGFVIGEPASSGRRVVLWPGEALEKIANAHASFIMRPGFAGRGWTAYPGQHVLRLNYSVQVSVSTDEGRAWASSQTVPVVSTLLPFVVAEHPTFENCN